MAQTIPSCTSNACQQGKCKCPIPTACQVPEDDEGDDRNDSALWWVFAATTFLVGFLLGKTL